MNATQCLRATFGVAALLGLAAAAGGQTCGPRWITGPQHVLGGANGNVWAMTMWDRDGAGPQAPVLVLGGGAFDITGPLRTNFIASWDPSTASWGAFGSGMNSSVLALAALPTGDLIAGGAFSVAGGVPALGVARWSGSQWNAMGGGLNGLVSSLTVWNGDLIAGGGFQLSGSTVQRTAARWNPATSTWSALGTPPGTFTRALAVGTGGTLSGALLLGGDSIGVQRWTGSAWQALGTGAPANVYAILPLPNGDLLAAERSGSTVRIARLANGQTAWTIIGTASSFVSSSSAVNAMWRLASGDVVVGGSFTRVAWGTNSVFPSGLARWTPSTGAWAAIGTGLGGYGTSSLTQLPTGEVVVGGNFTTANGVPASCVVRWNPATSVWTPFAGAAPDRPINALARLANGEILAVGSFEAVGGVRAQSVARWSLVSGSWAPVGSFGSAPQLGRTAVTLGAGQIAVGGGSAPYLSAWNGEFWAGLGGGANGTVLALAALPGGGLVAGGSFTQVGSVPASAIGRWNGSSWGSLGTGMAGAGSAAPTVAAVAVAGNGDIIAGGSFASAGGQPAANVARWNGASWSPLGAGIGGGASPNVTAIATTPTGDTVVAGEFSAAGGAPAANVARWNGASWSSLGAGVNGRVNALLALPDGRVVAAGAFSASGSAPFSNIAIWTGSAWEPLGPGLDGEVLTLALLGDGPYEVLAGGLFATAGPTPAVHWARFAVSGAPPITAPALAFPTVRCQPTSITASVPPGYEPQSFTWRRQGAAVPLDARVTASSGPASSTLTLATTWPSDAGSYDVVASSACGVTTSGATTLSVLNQAPVGTALAGFVAGTIRVAGNPSTLSCACTPFSLQTSGGSGGGSTGGGIGDATLAVAVSPGAAGTTVVRYSGSGRTRSLPEAGFASIFMFGEGSADGARLRLTARSAYTVTNLSTNTIAGSGIVTSFQPVRLFGPTGQEITAASGMLEPGDYRLDYRMDLNASGSQEALSTTNWALTLAPGAPCFANCDCSATVPSLNSLDFACFLSQFAAAGSLPVPIQPSSYANCDGSTTFPTLNALDFSCFLTRYRQGCP